MKIRWKFLRDGMKSENGNCIWKLGEWKHHADELSMCNSGFHCSKQINQAFDLIQGEILAKAQVKGKSIVNDDKEVWSDMRIVKAWKWQKKDNVALAIYAAEFCLKNFEKLFPDDKRPRLAIEAAKKWIKNPTEESASAASAASAARSAASAARPAASAARSAAWSAASAARSEIVAKIETWMKARAKKLEEIK
ncbi:MAG: hypothetical protein Q7J98_13135 [Kiritimatiellia bacterium]|nr:hypothetical protein [Kiritimatiellia bacterium]